MLGKRGYERSFRVKPFIIRFCRAESNRHPTRSFLSRLSVGVQDGLMVALGILRRRKGHLERPCDGRLSSKVFRVHKGIKASVSQIVCFFCCKKEVVLAGNFVGGARGAPGDRVRQTGRCQGSFLRERNRSSRGAKSMFR